VTVLIAGCGYVGIALAMRLSRDGTRAIGLRRNPASLPETVEGVGADLLDRASLRTIPEGITHVVITASPGGGDDERYVAAYLKGPETLLGFLRERGDPIRRVILTTSTGVYAQTDGSWVNEESETAPTHHSGKRMLEGEALIASRGYSSVALRLAGIYGPGRTRMIDRVRSGEARTPRDTRWTNRIHRDDCAGALALLVAAESPPPCVIGVDGEPAELSEVQRFLARELGVPEPPAEEEGSARAAVGRRARSNKRCSNELLVSLGYELAYPTYREGYRAMLAETTT
jgi:nucleoside-diphosphate-sugar epimerase